MQQPKSVDSLEKLGRVRLSDSFFLRDFLYSEVAQIYKMQNIPDDPDLAIEVGKHLCREILEPIQHFKQLVHVILVLILNRGSSNNYLLSLLFHVSLRCFPQLNLELACLLVFSSSGDVFQVQFYSLCLVF